MRTRSTAPFCVLALVLSLSSAPAPSAAAADLERVLVQLDVSAPPPEAGDAELETALHIEAMAVAVETLDRELAGTQWHLVRVFETIPWVALSVSAEARSRLDAMPLVLQVTRDETFRPLRLESPQLLTSGPRVQAPGAWELGFDGSGWTIAVIDSGVDAGHDFLAGKVVSEACYSSGSSCPNGGASQTGPGSGRPCTAPREACGHGTHVAGIAAGRNRSGAGIARGANLIGIQVFQPSQCGPSQPPPCIGADASDIIMALERVYALRSEHQIAAVNLSVGFRVFESEAACDAAFAPLKAVVDRLRNVGIVTVAAAGNGDEFGRGYTRALSSPACISSVVSVGATTTNDVPTQFSNVASFLDLFAPGMGVLDGIQSALPGNRFGRQAGTSQASPHVAGAFAILTQAAGGPAIDRIHRTLKETGRPIRDGRFVIPRIRIKAALESLFPARQSGIQVTPDRKYTLISKDVGEERWALTLNDDDGTLTGNVFSAGDETPQFIWCEETGRSTAENVADVDITYSCWSSGNCFDANCDDPKWNPLGEVPLPGSFFRPPSATGSAAAAAGTASSYERPTQATSASGLEITPDQNRVLVNKDLGAQRWAITRNETDGTVTGNVYESDGGEPTFLWCDPRGTEGGSDSTSRVNLYECWAAGPCTEEPCTEDQWTSQGMVPLSESFFSR